MLVHGDAEGVLSNAVVRLPRLGRVLGSRWERKHASTSPRGWSSSAQGPAKGFALGNARAVSNSIRRPF